MYGDIVEDLRDGLAVSAEHDRVLLRQVKKAARQLLQMYNFRESVRRGVFPILAAEDNIDFAADVGKVKRVILTTVEGGVKLYKPLRRKEDGFLPVYSGPSFYFIQGTQLFLDQPMPATLPTAYNVEVWYQSEDPDFCEPWLSVKYEAALEHFAGTKAALKMRKSEAAEIYGALWQQDVKVLGTYTTELEFGDMDIIMGAHADSPSLERYPA
jgi:hypothetical protein